MSDLPLPPSGGFLFVRHGESVDNARDRHSGGDANPVLTDLGRDQARATGARLHDLLGAAAWRVRFIVSPLIRTTDTARLLAQALGLPFDDVTFEPGFLERRLGRWNGLTSAEVPQSLVGSDATPPGGEDRASFRCRVERAALAAAALAGPDCLPLVVSSRGVARALGWQATPNAGLCYWPFAFAESLPGGPGIWPSPPDGLL
jgi:broad specificity phosphatase PhoE